MAELHVGYTRSDCPGGGAREMPPGGQMAPAEIEEGATSGFSSSVEDLQSSRSWVQKKRQAQSISIRLTVMGERPTARHQARHHPRSRGGMEMPLGHSRRGGGVGFRGGGGVCLLALPLMLPSGSVV